MSTTSDIKSNKIICPWQQQATVTPDAQSAGVTNVPMVSQEAIENDNNYGFTFKGFKYNTTNTNEVTEKEFDNAFKSLFMKYGANWADIKADGQDFFNKFMCKHTHSKKEKTLTREVLNQAISKVTVLLDILKSQNKEITFKNIMKAKDEQSLQKMDELFAKDGEITIEDIEAFNLMDDFIMIVGKHHDALKNMSQDEVQAIINTWKEAYNEIKNSGIKVTAMAIKNLANEYLILDKNNISREEFYNQKANGELKSIRELLGLSENEKITAEKVEEFFIKQNEEFKKKLDAETDPVKKAALIRELTAKQKENFTKMLLASNRADRKHLFHALKEMFAKNRGALFRNLLESIDEETRIELANSIDDKEMKDLLLNPDILNEVVPKEDATAITSTVVQYQETEIIKTNHAVMMVEAKEFFESIKEKLANGEKLTKEEQRLYDYFVARQAGEQFGLANHHYATVDEINNILNSFNNDSYSLPTYREVLETVVEYAEKNPEALTTSKEDFVSTMNKATNNNYTTVVNDMQNETQTVLNQPSNENASGYAGINDVTSNYVEVNNTVVSNQNPEFMQKNSKDLVENFYAANAILETKENQKDTAVEAVENNELASYINKNGYSTCITELLDSPIAGMQNLGKRLFKALPEFQEKFITSAKNSILKIILPITRKSVLAKIDKNVILSNHWATGKVREAIEEAKKDLTTHNA